jgi:hypothetical protein
MTLAEIVLDCQAAYGARYQCSTAKILQFINTIQQVAYSRDLLAFMWWEDFLTVYQDVVLSATGYTPFVAADVGKALTCADATGTIKSFNNAKYTVQVETTGTFSGAITTATAGVGAGTFDSQAVSKGPYSWASLAPSLGSLTAYTTSGGVRRMLGLTRLTDAELFGTSPPRALTDYGFSPGGLADKYFLENVRKYDVQQALKFIDTPDATAEAYRWLYFIRPPTINGQTVADNANLLIPPEYHETVVKAGVGVLADRSTYGGQSPEEILEPIMTPFWNAMQQPYQAMGDNANMTSEGTL